MHASRFAQVVGVAGAALALASCSGRTEPATEVGPHSAKLNAYGTADNGPAYSYFRYQRTEYEPYAMGWESYTPTRRWPAGAGGAFSETVRPLLAGTSYTYAVCGGDEGAQARCANTRTFTTTAPPVLDVVDGHFTQSAGVTGSVAASSGPTGASPSGTFQFTLAKDRFTGRVTCLAVSGTQATVGAVGTGNYDQPTTAVVTLVDGGTTDSISIRRTAGSTPPSCAGASFSSQSKLDGSSVVVQDAR